MNAKIEKLKNLIEALKDNYYLNYLDLCRVEACLGERAKLGTKYFGVKELEAHRLASEALGQHIMCARILEEINEIT